MVEQFFSGILAGIFVSLAGGAYLSIDNKIVGAVAFTIGLFSVCYYGANLYTGRVGYLFEKKEGKWASLGAGLVGNIMGTLLVGLLLSTMKKEAAQALCQAKLELPAAQILIRAIFCGMLMYIAVNLYRDKKTVIGIALGVPVFILSGFEHSIADMFYFFTAGILSGRMMLFILIALLGNGIGGLLMDRLLFYAGLKK